MDAEERVEELQRKYNESQRLISVLQSYVSLIGRTNKKARRMSLRVQR